VNWFLQQTSNWCSPLSLSLPFTLFLQQTSITPLILTALCREWVSSVRIVMLTLRKPVMLITRKFTTLRHSWSLNMDWSSPPPMRQQSLFSKLKRFDNFFDFASLGFYFFFLSLVVTLLTGISLPLAPMRQRVPESSESTRAREEEARHQANCSREWGRRGEQPPVWWQFSRPHSWPTRTGTSAQWSQWESLAWRRSPGGRGIDQAPPGHQPNLRIHLVPEEGVWHTALSREMERPPCKISRR